MTGELLHLSEGLRWPHVFDCPDLLWVRPDPPMRPEETQQLAGGGAKHTFLRVEPQIYLAQAGKSLLQIPNEGPSLSRFYHNVLNVGLRIPPGILA